MKLTAVQLMFIEPAKGNDPSHEQVNCSKFLRYRSCKSVLFFIDDAIKASLRNNIVTQSMRWNKVWRLAAWLSENPRFHRNIKIDSFRDGSFAKALGVASMSCDFLTIHLLLDSTSWCNKRSHETHERVDTDLDAVDRLIRTDWTRRW